MTKRVKKRIRFWIILVAAAAALSALLVWWANSGEESYLEKYEGVDLNADVGEISRDGTYAEYLRENSDAAAPQRRLDVALDSPVELSGAEICEYEGCQNVLLAQEDSVVTYELDVPDDGLYRLRFV